MWTGSRIAPALLVLAGTLSACSHDVDPVLLADLEALEIPLFLPDLRDSGLSNLHVDGNRAVADVTALVGTSYEQLPAVVDYGDATDLCASARFLHGADSDCRHNGDDALIADVDARTTVVVQRDGVFLVLRGLVTEADPGLALDAVEALQDAPEVSAQELAEAVPGFEGG